MSLLSSTAPRDLATVFKTSLAPQFSRLRRRSPGPAHGWNTRACISGQPLKLSAVAQVCFLTIKCCCLFQTRFQDLKSGEPRSQAEILSNSAPRDSSLLPSRLNTLYLRESLKSGSHTAHTGSIVVLGDCERGSRVRAEGDVLIFGRYRARYLAFFGALSSACCTRAAWSCNDALSMV